MRPSSNHNGSYSPPQFDLWAAVTQRRWHVEDPAQLRALSQLAARRPIAIYQDAGQAEWCPSHWPRVASWPPPADVGPVLAVTDQLLALPAGRADLAVVRPKTLAVGVACARGISPTLLATALTVLLSEHGLSAASLTAVAASARRRAEAGLHDYAEGLAVPLLLYPPEVLAKAPLPQDKPRKMAGTCARAALLAAGVRSLVVPSTPFGRLTLAVARRVIG